FLNFAPDHLDRHPTLEDYLDAKLRIFANQANEDVAVYNADDPALDGVDLGGCARRVAFCRVEPPTGSRPRPRGRRRRGSAVGPCEIALGGDEIFWVDAPLVDAERLPLLGEHNAENAMAAAAACLTMGLAPGDVRDGLLDFPGVPHRLERVAEIGGAPVVQHSEATPRRPPPRAVPPVLGGGAAVARR